MRPEFVDNRDGNTLALAIARHLSWLREVRRDPMDLSIATGYFDPAGFATIADELEHLGHIRLMLGAEPLDRRARRQRRLGEPYGERYDALLVDRSLRDLSEGLRQDRDLLGFTPEMDACLHGLLDVLASGRIEVRRYERRFLHGKAFIFSDDEGVLAGSSNFTAAGLTSNLELNLGRYDPTPVAQVRQWFDDLWEEAVPYDLASIYQARFEEYPPYLIYLRFLWELYRHEMQEEEKLDGTIPLTTFQTDGIFRAKRILDQYHGVLIADGVGLGKTFIAGELIRESIQQHRQRVLLISPAALRDGTWATFADRFQMKFESLSYEQLGREKQLGAIGQGAGDYLNHEPNEYGLVVIDEAQGFRNPNAQRSDALRRLLQGEPPKDLVLLSATPVNNSLWDLYYLLSYFVGHDAAFASRGLRSLRDRFKQATDEDPYELRPDMLFDVLDLVCVRRTRHFVRRYYPNETVEKPDGTRVPVRFPDPHAIKVTYELDDVLPGFFDELREALAPEDEDVPPTLTMARYAPSEYLKGDDEEQYEAQLVGLLRSALLKRFESSAYAFGRTLRRMIQSHERFLDLLHQGVIATPEMLREVEEVDNDEALEELLAEGEGVAAAQYDTRALHRDVSSDLGILTHFAEAAERVDRKHDPKLAALADEIAKIARQAEREGFNDQDIRNRRKVLVFTYYADTVDWIKAFLEQKVETDPRLAAYRGRIASVTSDDSRGGISRAAAIYGFAPVSTEAPAGRRDNLYDIVVTTDVLAEGLNLQQACHIINYDLPWNPMRIVQRNGRIDRIGSDYTDIYIRCFFPDRRLDDLLALEERLRRKLAQAAASIGIEGQVIPGGPTGEVVFSETRAEIEKLRREQSDLLVTAGEDPTAHSGEEYRQELRAGLERYRDQIQDLPFAAGSGYVGGARRGHVFCARVGEEHLFFRFVPADGGDVVSDTLTCLGLSSCTEDTARHLPDDLRESVYAAWEAARRDIYDQWMMATDPANLQPRVRRLFRQAAEHLRKHPPSGMTQEVLDRVVDAIEAPWPAKIERQLREVFDPESDDARATSQALIEKVRELGLRPYEAPEPLPVIDEDEIQLVAWMGVDAG